MASDHMETDRIVYVGTLDKQVLRVDLDNFTATLVCEFEDIPEMQAYLRTMNGQPTPG